MVKKREVPKGLRDQAVGLYRGGSSFRKIAQTLIIPHTTVYNIIYKWKKIGTTQNLPRVGRPRKQGVRQLRIVKRVIKNNQFKQLRHLSEEVRQHGINLPNRTLRRRIKDLGFTSCMTAKKPLITQKNRKKVKFLSSV